MHIHTCRAWPVPPAQESPEARQRQGKARWEPLVATYVEPAGAYAMSSAASKLLAMQPPPEASSVMAGSAEVVGTGT